MSCVYLLSLSSFSVGLEGRQEYQMRQETSSCLLPFWSPSFFQAVFLPLSSRFPSFPPARVHCVPQHLSSGETLTRILLRKALCGIL